MNPLLIAARFILPLFVLAFPLIGGFISVYLDGADWSTRYLFGIHPIGDYQLVDKLLDLFYLTLLVIVSRRFKNVLVRGVLLGLFIDRFIGIALFEITDMKRLLFVFPNIFENFFFFYYILKTVASYEPKISYRTLLFFLFLIGMPKILDEYLMHIIEKPFLKINLGLFTYTHQWPEYGAIFLIVVSIIAGIVYRLRRKN